MSEIQREFEQYRALLLSLRLASLRLPKIRSRLVDLLLDIHQPTKQRRISARMLVQMTGLCRAPDVDAGRLYAEILKLNRSAEWWAGLVAPLDSCASPEAVEWRRQRAPLLRFQENMIVQAKGLIVAMARKYAREDQLEDAMQDGVLGVMRALTKYDPAHDKRRPFLTYCAYWVRDAIQARSLGAVVRETGHGRKKRMKLSPDSGGIRTVSLDQSLDSGQEGGDTLHDVIAENVSETNSSSSSSREMNEAWDRAIADCPPELRPWFVLLFPFARWHVRPGRVRDFAEADLYRRERVLEEIEIMMMAPALPPGDVAPPKGKRGSA